MRALNILTAAISALLLAWPVAVPVAQEAGPSVIKQGSVSEDLYLAGGSVQLSADVEGDAVLAGGAITVTRKIAGDVLAAGGTINITADIGDDLRVAGGNVAISGNVADDAIAAGGNVTLGPDNIVGGRAWLAGGNVAISGHVREDVRAAGEHVMIAGEVDGDVELIANTVRIGPSAIIKGRLNYTSPEEARIADTAQIQGEVTYQAFEPGSRMPRLGGSIGGSFLFHLSLGVCAIVLFFLAPRFSGSVSANISNAPFRSLGLGLLVLIATPIAAAMLFVSILGIPLGMALLASCFVLVLLGLLSGFIRIGEWGFGALGKDVDQSRIMRSQSILSAAGVLFVVGLVPLLGSIVFVLVVMAGFGALILSLYRRYRETPKPGTAAPSSEAAASTA